MILAIDVQYNEVEKTAKAVGVLFNWLDDKPTGIVEVNLADIEEYIPGQFFRRELPSIIKVTEQIDMKIIEAIIVDGHVYVNNQKNYGLGGCVYQEFNAEIPVIGVAKTSYYSNEDTIIKVFRGRSKQPLYVSTIGQIGKEEAAVRIQNMCGAYRMPIILKELDRLTKVIDV